MTEAKGAYSLKTAYKIATPEEAASFYDGWAATYDAELTKNGYATPRRCAEALAQFVGDKAAPIMDLGCGTGLSGLALRAVGFSAIDGFDISPEMLAKAAGLGAYRSVAVANLAEPLAVAEGVYANAASIGCLSPEYLPVTVLDEILSKLPAGGCLVFSLNDHAAADGTMEGRVMELTDSGYAECLHRDYGEHIPGTGLQSTVYVLRRR
ncbi:MAG: methyltransferase domain-containing protein [Pseudomonadota bacterium]